MKSPQHVMRSLPIIVSSWLAVAWILAPSDSWSATPRQEDLFSPDDVYGDLQPLLPLEEEEGESELFSGIPLISEAYQQGSFFAPQIGSYEDWSISYELGVNGSDGNAVNFNLSTGLDLERKTESRITKITSKYASATNDGIATRDFALLRGRNEYLFADSPWSLFAESLLEYDRFQAFDLRLTLASGLGYRWVENDTTLIKSRMGLGTSREFGGPNEEWKPELVLGGDFKHQLSERQKLYCTIDYYPNWTNFSDFRLITDAGWEMVIDQAGHTSLKIGVIDRYDSTPEGRKANDLNYSILLLWKNR